jgi:AcrR family transcriptional regulator
MKEHETRRPYRMSARAEAAAQTARNILEATGDLWRERALDEFTLQEIADRAGVTVQTVLRRFGSKDGVIEAVIESDAAGIEADRAAALGQDYEAALDILIRHYERDGDAVLRTLALEGKLDAARSIVAHGRAVHREWCSTVFAPYLPPAGGPDHTLRLDAFVAATDLYLWKLLRRDRGRSVDHTRAVMLTLVNGLIAQAT